MAATAVVELAPLAGVAGVELAPGAGVAGVPLAPEAGVAALVVFEPPPPPQADKTKDNDAAAAMAERWMADFIVVIPRGAPRPAALLAAMTFCVIKMMYSVYIVTLDVNFWVTVSAKIVAHVVFM